MNSDLTGIILAGGQGKRMGKHKALIPLHGKPLIEYALDTLKLITSNIVLSLGSDAKHYHNLPVVKDIFPDCGPMGGVYSVLQFSLTDLNLVISCDMPFLPAELLNYLVEEAREHLADVTLPADQDGNWQTLCAVYRKSMLHQLEKAVVQKKLKLKTLISEVNSRIIPIEKEHKFFRPNAFLNMNTPGIIKITEERWGSL